MNTTRQHSGSDREYGGDAALFHSPLNHSASRLRCEGTSSTSRTELPQVRRTPRAAGLRMVAAVSLACALAATAHVPALADPKTPRTLTEVRGEIQRLYRDAEVATEKYNDTEEKLTRQRKRVTSLNAEADRAEAKVARLTTQVGAAARAQYRGGGGELPPSCSSSSRPTPNEPSTPPHWPDRPSRPRQTCWPP